MARHTIFLNEESRIMNISSVPINRLARCNSNKIYTGCFAGNLTKIIQNFTWHKRRQWKMILKKVSTGVGGDAT